MPVDLEKIKNLSKEQIVIKRSPRSYRTKQKQIQNLTHWVVVENGKAVSSITKNKHNMDTYTGLVNLQKLVCFDKLQCECGLVAELKDYKFKEIYYYCPEDHLTKISEYA